MARDGNDKTASKRLHTRWTLVESLKRHDPAGWKEFSSIYGHLIHAFAVKSGCTQDEAQEVFQETMISVAKEILQFNTDRSRGSFGAWLHTITRRRIVDQFRKRPPQGCFVEFPRSATGTRTPPINQIASRLHEQDEYWDEQWRETLFQRSIERLKPQVSTMHFKIFYLAVIKEQSASEVAKALNVSSARVYLVKHRLSAMLKREMKRLDDGNL